MTEARDELDLDQWLDELPPDFCTQVVAPLRYEAHVDSAAHARKVVGLDAQGLRCYVRHTHTVTEERFDIDEWPVEVAVLRERRIAWRLGHGGWLRVVDRMDRLESCRPRHWREGPEVLPGFPADL